MATPEQNPYNTYLGNGVTTEFSIGFSYINPSFIHVYVKRGDGEQVEIPSTDFDLISSETIRYPGNSSSDTVLGDGDVISIHRETPLKSDYVFSNQKRLFPEDVMKADDLDMQIIQELRELIYRCFRLTQTASGAQTLDLSIGTIVPNRVLKWNEDGTGFVSSEYDPDELAETAIEQAASAAQSVLDAKEQADIAKGYAEDSDESATNSANSADASQWYYEHARFGKERVDFLTSDWSVSGDYYTITVNNGKYVDEIYKKNGSNYDLVANVDVIKGDTTSTIKSIAPFDGFYLLTFPDTVSYTHNQETPALTWTINHNMDKYPSVTIVDDNGIVMVGTVQYVSSNQVVVTFLEAVSGKAYLN